MLIVGCCLDRARDRMLAQDSDDAVLLEKGGGKGIDDREVGTGLGTVAEVDEADEASGHGWFPPGGPLSSSSPPSSSCVRLMHSRGCVFLGFHHLTTLSFEFWCHLVSITLYGGSYFTFLGARGTRVCARPRPHSLS
jgi:hypothetical protein